MTEEERLRRKPKIFHDRRLKINSKQWDEIFRRYEDGENSRDLALEFGVTHGYLRGQLSARRF